MIDLEISDELYNKIMEFGKDQPFEATLWSLLKSNSELKKANKATMLMMMGSALGLPQAKIEEEINQIMAE